MTQEPLQHITEIGVVPVVTVTDLDEAVQVIDALVAGGLTAIEVTLRTEFGLEAIRRVTEEVPGALVGAGSVTAPQLVERALGAGARFLVAPGYDAACVAEARTAGVELIPGVATATELMRAVNDGVETVKVFPASQLGGPAVVKAFASVWPTVRFMPTGGIDATTAADYLAIDRVVAVGGSWMLPHPTTNGVDREATIALAEQAAQLGRARR